MSNSDMLGLEGPKSYQPGYATSARLWCLRSQVGHEPTMTSLDGKVYVVRFLEVVSAAPDQLDQT